MTSEQRPYLGPLDARHELDNMLDASRATGPASDEHHRVECRRDLGAYRPKWEPDTGEQHERLEARERVGRAVGVKGRKGAVVTGVERLEHVERFAAPHLSDDDAIRAHP